MDLIQKINDGRTYRAFALVSEKPDDAESYNVRGYASTFEQAYTLWDDAQSRLDEIIDRHAFDECDMSDVIFQYDHEGRVFARTSNDTLKITTDDHGLLVNAYLGGTDIGRGLYGEIKGGYTSKMSFGFRVDEDKITSEERDGKVLYIRRITKIRKLYDVSAVSMPANDGTEISARSLRDGAIAKLEAERLVKAEREKTIRAMLEKIETMKKGAEL